MGAVLAGVLGILLAGFAWVWSAGGMMELPALSTQEMRHAQEQGVMFLFDCVVALGCYVAARWADRS